MLCFAGHVVSIVTTQLCYRSLKAAIYNTYTMDVAVFQ